MFSSSLAAIAVGCLAVLPGDPRTDCFGDPLPPGASARLGTLRWRLNGSITSVAFPPDGKTIVVAGDGTVRLWDLATGRELRRLVCQRGGKSSACLLADGKTLEIWDGGGTRPWDLEGWKELPEPEAPKEPHTGLYYPSPDGRILVVGDKKGMISLRDARTGRERCRLEEPLRDRIWGLQFSPDGSTAASINGRDVTLWDTETGRKLHTVRGFEDVEPVQSFDLWMSFFSLTFSPDSKKLVTATEGSSVIVWDVVAGKELHRLDERLKKKALPVRPVLFTPDGKTLVVPGDQAVYLCDAASGRLVGEVPTRGYAVLALGPDGKTLVLGGAVLRLLDLSTGKDTLPAFGGHESGIHQLAFLPEGKTVLTGGEDGTVRLWDAATGRQLRQFDAESGMWDAGLSSDCRLLAVTELGGKASLWDVAKGERWRRWQADSVGLSAVALSPDGKTLATSGDNAVHLWDAAAGAEFGRTKPQERRIYKIAFSPDGKRFAAAERFDRDGGQALRLFDAATGGELRPFTGPGEKVQCFAFSPDGATLAAAADGEPLRLWEAATGQERARLPIPRGVAFDLAFSPDGRLVALGQAGQPTRLWDVLSGKEVGAFDDGRGGACRLAFAPDGRTLATSGETSALIWPLDGTAAARRPDEHELSDDQREAAWEDLADADAARAYQAGRAMAEAPESAIGFLQGRLEEDADAAERVQRLIARLDSDDFTEREQVEAALRRMGRAAEAALRRTLQDPPSVEVRSRVESLTQLLKPEEALSPTELRGLRALEALERMGGAQARQALEALSARAEPFRVREEAKACLKRLAGRTIAP